MRLLQPFPYWAHLNLSSFLLLLLTFVLYKKLKYMLLGGIKAKSTDFLAQKQLLDNRVSMLKSIVQCYCLGIEIFDFGISL